MSRLLFTGERLHEGSELFGVDLVRHRAAYNYAFTCATDDVTHDATRDDAAGRGESDAPMRVLDLGCGTGYGVAELAASLTGVADVFAIDRISPDAEARHAAVHYLRADAGGIPLPENSFDLVVSFQVIEHLEDPSPYLGAISGLVRPEGCALITTPNLLTSDGENPFHVHEYAAGELESRLRDYFDEVEMLGVTATPEPMAYYNERLERIRGIMRIDPLGLRRLMPRTLIDWLFARFAIIVRRGIQQKGVGLPKVTLDDFPIVPVDDDCLDLLAVCRRPKKASSEPGASR